ncbi:MAG: aminotransferase class V-fold PLP-dependent enzyme [Spirosomaceae bacterium]|nr:aminotransferase class V-fold PLP-dependent enzyme [Spirosomataceae bacterium]
MPNLHQKAIELDKKDLLAHFRRRFTHDETIYLDGNSLGKLPKQTPEIVAEVVNQQWGSRMIRSWNEHWIDLPNKVAAQIAKVIGANADEVFVGDSTSVNLYKLAFAALNFNTSKNKIITDSLNFPTDLYILQGLVQNQFSHVLYKSAFMYDMKRINDAAHKHNSLVIWDLSHAAGAVEINLNDTNADMAIGCTYKYLNGGPGSPAFLYVRRDLQEKLVNPIWGWFSHQKPFDFGADFTPNDGIQRFAVGTPSVLSLAATQAGLAITNEAGMKALRQKSITQSSFLIELIEQYLIPLGFTIASPLEAEKRGSHISIQHPEGYRINRAMIEPKNGSPSIIPDFRPPNNIRLGIAPLYNTFEELYHSVIRIKKIVETEEYKTFGVERLNVT